MVSSGSVVSVADDPTDPSSGIVSPAPRGHRATVTTTTRAETATPIADQTFGEADDRVAPAASRGTADPGSSAWRNGVTGIADSLDGTTVVELPRLP